MPLTDPKLVTYINLKLAALGCPTHATADAAEFRDLTESLLARHRETERLLADYQAPVDWRIQQFLDEYLHETGVAVRLPHQTFVLVPLPRYTTVSGIPVTELIDEAKLTAILERTKKGGGELVNLMGTSAWYAPGAAAAQMVEAILKNENRIYPCCCWLQGEYGMKDIYLGVPVKLGRNGIEEIIELKLNNDEMTLLKNSSVAVKEVMNVLDNMNAVAS